MSLREHMHRTDARVWERGRYERYGFIDNPFPAAGQSSGHPRMEDEIDDEMEHRVRRSRPAIARLRCSWSRGYRGSGRQTSSTITSSNFESTTEKTRHYEAWDEKIRIGAG